MWQDIVISIGQILFGVALLPSIFGKGKPHWGTSLLTAFILTVFTYTFWTLALTYGAVTSGIVALCWWILFFQVFKKGD